MDPMMKYENRKIDRIAKEAMANLRKAGRMPEDDVKSTGSRSSAIEKGMSFAASLKMTDKGAIGGSHHNLPHKPIRLGKK